MAIPAIHPYKMPGTNDLPEKKVNWKLDRNRAVLLIHDMQQYFLNPFVPNESPFVELIDNIKQIKKKCEELQIPIVYTAQPGAQKKEDRALLTDFWGPGLADDDCLTKIVDEIAPSETSTVNTKWRYSAFKRSNLLSMMNEQGRDQLIICGVYAHIGCLLTACDAFMEDIEPFFVVDAVADFSLDYHKMAMNYVSARCGVATSTNLVLQELDNDTAKQMSPTLTLEGVRNTVVEMINISPAEIDDHTNLVDMGLDSIRLMSLVEEWRSECPDINFMKLAEKPTIANWWELLSSKQEIS
ncbi:isochorismatase family protein [Lysinibacillus sp. NPDC096418]|uniref:isochorismatase family protein n=1 Tax=Lysinibacillus sp. NPDC096418 TaxID=3364138 RepID=UPI0038274972